MDFQKLQDARLATAIIGFSLLMIYILVFSGNTEIGDYCTANRDCEDGLCMTVNESLFCTRETKDCPIGSRAMNVDVYVDNGKSFRDTQGEYCVPARLVKSVKKGARGKIWSRK